MADAELGILLTLKDQASATLKNFQSNIKDIQKNLLGAAGAMGAIGGAITAIGVTSVKEFAETGHEIELMSEKTGMSTKTVSILKYALDLTGGSLSNLQMGFRTMAKVITDASEGQKAAQKTLDELNLTAQDFIGLSPDEAFMKMAYAVSDIEDPITRARLATELFGRSGMDLLPMLAEGSQGITDMANDAEKLGVVFDTKTAKQASNLQDNIEKVNTAINGMKNAIATALLPVLDSALPKLIDIIGKIRDWIVANPELVKAVVEFGVALSVIAAILVAVAAGLAIVQALSGPVGWIALAAGLAIAAGAVVGINKLIGGTKTLPSYQYGGVVSGPIGAPIPVMAHGGEMFAGVGRGLGGGSTVVNVIVQGSTWGNSDLAEEIRRQVVRARNRNYTTGLA